MSFLRRLMIGRNGVDQLGLATMVVYFLFYVLALFTHWLVFYLLGLVFVAIAFYRVLSRNIARRQRENAWFLKVTAPARNWWRTRHMMRTDKDHCYFKCPQCGQQLRVPRGNGKIRVTCRSCGASFEKKS